MNKEQLDQLKRSYAEMIIESMDMKLLIEFAEDSIVENIKDYDLEDLYDLHQCLEKLEQQDPTMRYGTIWCLHNASPSKVFYSVPLLFQMTESNILRQYNRYMAIDELLKDQSLWGMITEAMLSRYSNDELKAKGSGQTSISNMIERKVLAKFDTIYDTYAISHSVTGKDTDRALPIVPNTIADDVRAYITSLEF